MSWVATVAPTGALLCVAGFGVIAPPLARGARPAAATWLLTVGSVASAVSGVLVLAMMASPLIGRDDAFADFAHLSTPVLAKSSRTGVGVAAMSLAALLLLLTRACMHMVRRRRAYADAARFAASVGYARAPLVVLPSDDVDAFAVGAHPGVVVATRGLLRVLRGEERRAVLAHERSHLRHRHHRHIGAVSLAAALNPFLRRIPDASSFAVERWADEESARRTSRPTAASALARVVAARGDVRVSRPRSVLGAATVAVTGRIAALRAAPPATVPLRLVLPGLLSAAAVLAAGVVTGHTWDVFRVAMAATHHVLHRH